jgi:hypothetical protein
VVVEHQSLDGLEDLVAGLLGLEGQLFGTEITGEFQVIGEMGDKLLVVELPVTGFYLPDFVDIQGFSPLSVRETDLPGCGIDLGTLADRQETEQPVKKTRTITVNRGIAAGLVTSSGFISQKITPPTTKGSRISCNFKRMRS